VVELGKIRLVWRYQMLFAEVGLMSQKAPQRPGRGYFQVIFLAACQFLLCLVMGSLEILKEGLWISMVTRNCYHLYAPLSWLQFLLY
jgi:hypothetical protein